MVEEEPYCIDIISQIAAVRAALARVEEEILQDHIAHCVEQAIASGNANEQRYEVAKLMEVLARACRQYLARRSRSVTPSAEVTQGPNGRFGHPSQPDETGYNLCNTP